MVMRPILGQKMNQKYNKSLNDPYSNNKDTFHFKNISCYVWYKYSILLFQCSIQKLMLDFMIQKYYWCKITWHQNKLTLLKLRYL